MSQQDLSPVDLQPVSTRANVAFEAVLKTKSEHAGGHEFMLNYMTRSAKVLMPLGRPMSYSMLGNRSDVKPGETVFASACLRECGMFTAVRVQVSRYGVKPT